MTGQRGVAQVTGLVTALTDQLPRWATLVRAPNPGPMTLDGTNTWVIRPRGAAAAVVVDPGPDDAAHLQRVAAAAGPVAGILTTHGHPDHVAGLARFQELTGAPQERPGFVTVLATPGHTADSVCFLVDVDGERAVLTGDTILGRGTTVVAWPDGDLADYLASLARLTSLTGVPVLPGHGPPLADCAAAARSYLAHRKARLDQVRDAVAAGARTPADVVAAVYADVDPGLRPAAHWSAQAQLAFLRGAPPPADPPTGEEPASRAQSAGSVQPSFAPGRREQETGARPLDEP